MTPPRRSYGPNPPGRLHAAMLRALAAELADPGRFGRAKAYARDGNVVDIVIEPGEARAEIRGSRFEPYLTRVFVVAAHESDTLLGLIPDRDEISAECTCPDDGPYGGEFCKHALATLLVLADEVTVDTEALVRWRSGPSRPAIDEPPISSPRRVRAVVDVLASSTTAPRARPELPVIPTRVPVAMGPPDDQLVDQLASVLADALSTLRGR